MTDPNPHRPATAGWPNLVGLYPLYCALARESAIEMQPCPELDQSSVSPVDIPSAIPSAEELAAAEKWVAAMDERIQPHQLRQFLQNSGPVDEDVMQQFLAHHLSKKQRSHLDRDKVDFLLVQLFSQRAPADVSDSDLSFEAVAVALDPVLNTADAREPKWLDSLDELVFEANRAKDLNWLFTNRIIERGREIKHSCGEKFFDPAALADFTRFGFLMRRKFFRLMHQDLNTILDGLRHLEARGIETLDCRKAQFAADEPIPRLRMICQSWKVMFHAEYCSGQPLCILVDLRTAVESALGQNQKARGLDAQPQPAPELPAEPKTHATAEAQLELKERAAAADASIAGPDASASAAEAGAAAPDSTTGAVSARPAANAAAAGVDSGAVVTAPKPTAAAANDAPEFEVSVAPSTWDGDASI
jgi:hypothetical protein